MATSSFRGMYRQLAPLPSVKSFARPLTGRTVLLTGGNVGLGLETAKHLAALGPARLIITSRSAARGAAALKEIEASGKGKCVKVECWEVDCSNFASVKALAERFAKDGGGKLDLLVLNAGVACPWRNTPDGWEEMVQVNHLSTALLAIRMLPFLLAAKPDPPTPRIVIVSSGVHLRVDDVPEFTATNMLRKLNNEKEYGGEDKKMFHRYGLSKLFNVFFTVSLSERLPSGSPLSVNAVAPGFCHSQLLRNVNSWGFWLYAQVMARRTEVGSRTLVHAAVGKDLDGKSGQYVESCFVSKPSELVRSERGKQIRDKLWADTILELTLVDHEVPNIVKKCLS
ncbi:NAD(P)-binding protein [Calocera viscosa TUFC12733]|uniref:NAD(P)-binding protein n=1 Tax=Calocera viscosa (strain TUFC12733) TaxID=1330018 RepID=A0A167PID3_CALVF|nr:NAD(P)-binding protein [Calocera viscosa TUFC12733]